MITFVTGNDAKWQSACRVLEPYGVDLMRAVFELPEVQSLDVEEVARTAAGVACGVVGGPVIVTDAGYYFEGLKGFPGPFVKYVNQMLTADDMVRLMEGKEDRRVTIREALAYCEPGHPPVVFVSEMYATAATEVGSGDSMMDKVTILEGFGKVVGECDEEQIRAYWYKHLRHYARLGEWLAARI